MNPIKWIRWKIVIVFGVIIGALYFLGLNPLARQQINGLGASGKAGARFSIEQIGLGLLQGRTNIDAFKLATPRQTTPQDEAKERVASADEVVFDMGMDDLLRRRFAIDEMGIKKPILRIERREDGTINVGEIGSTEPEKPAGKPTDWVKAVEEWAQKIKKRIEERQKKKAEEKAKGQQPAKRDGLKADYAQKVDYPFENNPRAVVRKVTAEAMEIQFEDRTGALKPPPITDAKVTITNLTDRPDLLAEPIGLEISGKIGEAPISVTGTIDLRKIAETGVEKNDLILKVTARNLPLQQVVQAFAGDSLNATFSKGTADLNADLSLLDLERLGIRSLAADKPLFALHGVQMEAKPGSKIAGLDGKQFATAVNEVGDLEISDLEIGGTLTSPEFKWGDTIKDLVVSGGKAFAQKQAQKGLDKGAAEAQKLLDKQLKNQPEAKKALEKLAPEGDVKKALGEGAGGLLDGLLGGKKKKAEQK